MKGMTTRVTYWAKSECLEKGFSTERVILDGKAVILETPTGNLRIENGNRISTAKLIRPKPVENTMAVKVTGWDKRMNTVSVVCKDMDEALELACGMLHARLRPTTERG